MGKKKEDLDQDYHEIGFSLIPHGQKVELPPTFEEYAKTKSIISPAKNMKQ